MYIVIMNRKSFKNITRRIHCSYSSNNRKSIQHITKQRESILLLMYKLKSILKLVCGAVCGPASVLQCVAQPQCCSVWQNPAWVIQCLTQLGWCSIWHNLGGAVCGTTILEWCRVWHNLSGTVYDIICVKLWSPDTDKERIRHGHGDTAKLKIIGHGTRLYIN